MSKLYKALAKAEQDRLRRQPNGIPGERSTQQGHTVASASPDISHQSMSPPDGKALLGLEEHLVTLRTPGSFEAEQYRSLAYTIQQLHTNAGLDVVAVSSPAVGDGKTTTAINLAAVLAQIPGMRVLLVEADVRQPAIGRYLGEHQAPLRGLGDLMLEPSLPLQEVIWTYTPRPLGILTAGCTSASPHELLASPRLGMVFQEARQLYDCVVVDTPPLIPLSDCRLIGKWVDGFLIVVAVHKTTRRLLEEALTVVEPDKRVGLVINKDERIIPGYYSSSVPSVNGQYKRRHSPG